jgi:flagellar M-ring protein FliF
MAFFGKLLIQLRNLYVSLPPSKKMGFWVLFVMLIGLSIGAVIIANKAGYVPLYSGLSQEDASAILKELDATGIDYQVTAGGTIKINGRKHNVYQTRMEIAGKGLPSLSAQPGFTDLYGETGTGITLTDNERQIQYRRALEGELARTIKQIDGVENSRIHIAIPTETTFVGKEIPVTASVHLKLYPQKTLSSNNIKSIQSLVAGSVPELKSEDVTVIDNLGNMLSRDKGDGKQLSIDTEDAYRNDLERDLENKIVNLLGKMVGRENIVVKVSADVVFQKIETETETYSDDEKAIISEQTIQGQSSSNTLSPQGVAGVQSNLPDKSLAEQKTTSQPNNTVQNMTLKNYIPSKTISKTISPLATIKKVSAAVSINGKYATETDKDGKTTSKYIDRTTQELSKFEDLAKSAIGFNSERGDIVTVTSYDFFKPEEIVSVDYKKLDKKELIGYGIRYGIYGFLGLLFIFLILRPLIKGVLSQPVSLRGVNISELLPRGGEETESYYEGVKREELEKFRGQKDVQKKLDKDMVETDMLAKSDPGKTAYLIKSWLKEGK